MNQKIAAIELLSVKSLIVALLFRLVGYKIVALNQTDYAARIMSTMGMVVELVDFNQAHAIDPSLTDDDSRGYCDIVMKRFTDINCEGIWIPMFSDLKQPQLKLDILLRHKIQSMLSPIRLMLAWREDVLAMQGKTKITLVLESTLPAKILAKHLKFSAFFLPTFHFIDHFMVRVLRSISRMPSKSHKPESDITHQYLFETAAISDVQKYEVLFFPHNCIGCAKLYSKDHFYSSDPASSLHPSKVLHVELEGHYDTYYDDIYFDPKQLGVEIVNFYLLPNGIVTTIGYLLKCTVQAYVLLLSSNNLWRSPWNASSFLAVANMVALAATKYKVFQQSCRVFKAAKVALVGYDFLFPPHLAMALESLGIKTIAVQERLLGSVYKSVSVSFDTYMVASEQIREAALNRTDYAIENIIPVGLQRSDYLHTAQANLSQIDESEPAKNVLVLDYLSEKTMISSRLTPLTCWAANYDFYKIIITLALNHTDVQFTIRGKNTLWTKLTYFAEVKNQIESMGNINISMDYTKEAEQYSLAATADLVIARHTSMVDDCILAGKLIVLADFYPNALSYIDKFFDYDGFLFTAQSRKDLVLIVGKLLNGECKPVKLDDSDAVYYVFGPYDGRVKERIRKETACILASCGGGDLDKMTLPPKNVFLN